MNKLSDLLVCLSLGGATTGILGVLGIISTVLGILASLIAIVAGILGIILKLKDALADGKIDKDELKDIRDSADDVIDDINKRLGDKDE